RLIALDELRIVLALDPADLDQDCRYRSAAAALDPDIIAVFLRRESCCRPLTGVDLQARELTGSGVALSASASDSLKSLSACAPLARVYRSRKSPSSLSQV